MPLIADLVVFGWCDVIAILLPTSALIKVDFQTFGRPTIATNPDRKPLILLFSHCLP